MFAEEKHPSLPQENEHRTAEKILPIAKLSLKGDVMMNSKLYQKRTVGANSPCANTTELLNLIPFL